MERIAYQFFLVFRTRAYYAKECAQDPEMRDRSMVRLDFEGGDDTDMEAIQRVLRSILWDRFVYGNRKVIPTGKGLDGMRLFCSVEDEKWIFED